MKRRIFVTLLVCFALISALIVGLLSSPGKRNSLYRIVAEAPGVGFYFVIRKHVIARDFVSLNIWLNRQLLFAKKFSKKRTVFIPGLIKNAKYVVSSARFPEDFLALKPFFKTLVGLEPDIYQAHIWYSMALSYSDSKKAIKQLNKAIKLIPGHHDAYKIAIAIHAREGDLQNVKDWCVRFKKEKWGGEFFYDYHTLFFGNNYRKLALEVNNDDGTRQIIAHRGMVLNQDKTYEFSYNKSVSAKSIRLHLGIPEAVGIQFTNIYTYHQGIQKIFDRSDYSIGSFTGFFGENGRYYSTVKDGSTINFYFKKPGVLHTPVDRFDIQLRIEKASPFEPPLCMPDNYQ